MGGCLEIFWGGWGLVAEIMRLLVRGVGMSRFLRWKWFRLYDTRCLNCTWSFRCHVHPLRDVSSVASIPSYTNGKHTWYLRFRAVSKRADQTASLEI